MQLLHENLAPKPVLGRALSAVLREWVKRCRAKPHSSLLPHLVLSLGFPRQVNSCLFSPVLSCFTSNPLFRLWLHIPSFSCVLGLLSLVNVVLFESRVGRECSSAPSCLCALKQNQLFFFFATIAKKKKKMSTWFSREKLAALDPYTSCRV